MDQRTDELVRDGRAADRIDKERAELFEAMIRTKAWLLYHDLITAKVEQLGSDVLEPANGVDGAVALEYVKGTLKGLLLARDLPSATVGQMKALRAQDDSETEEDANSE